MGEGKRILLVEGSGRGFLCHYANALALGLHELGHRVLLVTGRRDELAAWPAPFAKSACLQDGVAAWLCLAAKVREFRPDIVHFQWVGQPLWAAAFVAWLHRRGIIAIYTPHNLLPHRRRWLSAPGFRLLYRTLDQIVARDPHIAWGLEEMLGIGNERIALLPGSPNLMAHPAMKRRLPPELPAKTASEISLLYFGHGSARKGLGHLLSALESLDWPPSLRLIVAGEGVLAGADAGALARVAAKTPVAVIDRYLDPAEVAGLFAVTDLMVMPYAKQCKSPLTDLAAAFGVPVLRTDRVEAARFIENVHGCTVEHRVPGALAGGLRQCLERRVLNRLREALRREEGIEASIRRLARGHARLYAGLPVGDTALAGAGLWESSRA